MQNYEAMRLRRGQAVVVKDGGFIVHVNGSVFRDGDTYFIPCDDGQTYVSRELGKVLKSSL